MTHAKFSQPRRGPSGSAGQSGSARHRASDVVDLRHPSDAFLLAEIEGDRRGERRLVPKTLIAGLLVAALVVLRQLLFV